jgi:co-chaperonin GroES (HSP10)
VNILPEAGFVVLRPQELDTPSGIVIPNQDKEKTNIGEVVSDGDSKYEPGQRVIYSRWAGMEVEDLLIIKREDIFGRVE